MKQKMTIKAMGMASVLAAFSFVGCDVSFSGPDITPSSSSVVQSSSSIDEGECIYINHECDNCKGPDCPVYVQPCDACDEFGAKAVECGSGKEYVCLHTWVEESRIHDEDFYCGLIAPGECIADEDYTECEPKSCNPDGPLNKQDCYTGENFVCEFGYWQHIEACRNITNKSDQIMPYTCDTELEVALDCVRGYHMICANGTWLDAPDCNRSKDLCGFDAYKLCMEYGLRDFCNDDWVAEPCEEEGATRDLRVFPLADSDTFVIVNFVCRGNVWIDRANLFECPDSLDCTPRDFTECRADEIVGTSCDENDEETAFVVKDGCDFACRDGKYEFMPPPMLTN